MPDVDNKLATARTRLILDKPFLGALVLRLPMVEGDPSWCETTFSDGKTFYYNSDYIDALDNDQAQFALSHGHDHAALCHGDQWLGDATQFLGLGNRGLDQFMFEQ